MAGTAPHPVAATPSVLRGDARPDLIRDETLSAIFAGTVREVPARVAIIDGDRRFTYRELDAAAEAVALRLRAVGAAAGRIVGLWMGRGAEALVVQLGIAKSGAAWLPFDADAPPDRVAACLADAGALAVVVDAARRAGVGGGPECAVLDAATLFAPSAAGPPPLPTATVNDVAYVIYTSGSTGRPKGIAVANRAICHFLRSENALLGIGGDDLVYQGFSLAFDMSFEEIWISYLAGATLWIAGRSVSADPDAIATALGGQRITVLHAVPSLLAVMPPLPACVRLVNLGGEACPQAVADRVSAPGRRVFNTYGPTETTVSATIAALLPGVPVTIGRPLPNYGVAVVGADGVPVPSGDEGELCVFGPGLAIGYLARPELTRERFPAGPFAGLDGVDRLYRTGDLARIGADGGLRFLGRIDDQVKVRGYRVELGEVDAALASAPGILAAAVVVRPQADGEALIAFVVADGGVDRVPAARAHLDRLLPAYMRPQAIVAIEALPRLPSGKADRRALRELPLPEVPPEVSADQPATASEVAISAALAALFPGHPYRRGDDFFTDLGGHSLTAARLVSRLRSEHGLAHAAVGMVYAHRRLGAIAEALERATPAAPAEAAPPARRARARRLACGCAQALVFPLPLCLHLASWLAPFFTYHLLTGDEGDSIAVAGLLATGVFVLTLGASFVVAIAAKWLVVGRLRPGRYPLWGTTYFRWWFASIISDAVPTYLLHGTPLYASYLRLLGARIGRDVHLGAVDVDAPDLLDIGAGAALGTAVAVANARVDRGELVVEPVRIGADALVDSYTVLQGGSAVGAAAEIGPLSSLPPGTLVPDGERWEGIPARRIGPVPAPPPRLVPGAGRRLFECAFYPAAGSLVAALFFVPVFPAFMLIDWIDANWLDTFGESIHALAATGAYLLLGLPAGAALVLVTLAAAATLRWVTRPAIVRGTWPVHGRRYYGRWIGSQIQENSLHLLHGLFATIYAPTWFRLIGARVGRHAEISTAVGVAPEALELGDDCFVADGAMLGDEQVRGGRFTLAGTRIGDRSFIGNGACVPDGAIVPDDVLIGVHSLAPPNPILASGQTWLGSPPLALPAREPPTAHPIGLTFRPSRWRRIGRGLVELARIVVPLAFVMAFGYLAVFLIVPTFERGRWLAGLAELSLAGFLYGGVCVAFVLAAKWLLIGRYRPRQAPMWTAFVWLSEAVTAVYESLAVPNFLLFLRGTPMLPFFLRLFGTRIGRGVYLDTTDITEFDCVEIGDDAELNADCGPQTHLFEDRVMKIGRVRIGARACIGARCTILYDVEVGDGVSLAASTLVAKGERLPPDTAWSGSPAAPAAAR